MRLILFFLILFIYNVGDAQTLNTNDSNKIVATIYIIEGGSHTKYPYGVRSIETGGDTNKARRICMQSVLNNWTRFQHQNKQIDFISFMADRWVPRASDFIGNKNFINNAHKILGSNFCARINKNPLTK